MNPYNPSCPRCGSHSLDYNSYRYAAVDGYEYIWDVQCADCGERFVQGENTAEDYWFSNWDSTPRHGDPYCIECRAKLRESESNDFTWPDGSLYEVHQDYDCPRCGAHYHITRVDKVIECETLPMRPFERYFR